jgi:uncharacterized protein YndB with AHSA1/START domain
MAANPESGFLLIADLTGYTAYLSRGELEHAPVIAGDLLETIVGRLEPPFRLAKLEGDAAFLFVEDGRADGPLLVDAVEAAYLAFRRRLRSIQGATACSCQACGLAPRLDLKLFLHHGAFVRSTIAGRDELAGPSVILVHRLLKGSTATAEHDAAGGARGFAILTGDAVASLGIDPRSIGATPSSEVIDPFGDVSLHLVDLETRWQAEQLRRRIDIPPADATLDLEVVVPAPPADVWARLTSPGLRAGWEGSIVVLDDPAAIRGVGSTARCVTGRLASLEEIVDWQPYEHIGYRLTVAGIGPVEAAYDLTATDASTQVRLRWSLPPGNDADPEVLATTIVHRRAALDRLVATTHRPAALAGTQEVRS